MSIEVALSKLRSAQICHPNAVQFLIDEAITAIQQAGAKTDVRCEGCGYMTHHREHMGCVRAAKQFTHPAPGVPDDVARHIVGWWLCNEANPQDGSPWTTEPSQRVLDHMKVVSGEKHTVMRLVAIDAAMLAAK